MARKLIQTLTTVAVASLCSLSAFADTVTTQDGSRLEGEIVKVSGGKIHLKTSYAGTIEIDQASVVGFTTADPLFLRTEDGEVFSGSVSDAGDGNLEVNTSGGTVTVPKASVSATWNPGDEDPKVVAERRTWTANVGVSLVGKSGNTESTNIAGFGNVKLEGPKDRLRFYGLYTYETSEITVTEDGNEVTRDDTTSDEVVIGSSYTYFITERLGWYVRAEGERDPFEDIDLRFTAAAGATWKFIDRERLTLEGRAGLSYRYEDYSTQTDPSSDSFPGLDFGLDIFWQFAEWGEFRSSITYLPSFDDFGNYLLEHDTFVLMPLQVADNWSLRTGVRQKYDSEPAEGKDSTDTTYYASLVYTWK